MILIAEQDLRKYDGKRFTLKPGLFKGAWKGKVTWRAWWGFWSLSYYPEKGLKDFLDYVPETEWRRK